MIAETLGDTLGNVEAEALLHALADTVAEIETETLYETLSDMKAYILVEARDKTPAKVGGRDTQGEVKAKAPLNALADTLAENEAK